MPTIPADIILHIFSLLPLSDICHLINQSTNQLLLYFYLKQILLSRIKHDKWNLVLHTPSTYFAILCNRDMLTSATTTTSILTCVGYNSQSEYLRFETESHPLLPQFEMADEEEIEFQSIRIYCAQWINLFNEDDPCGLIKLLWREGDQTKQIGDMFISYKCITKVVGSAERECEFCKYYNRCDRHAFLSIPTKTKKRVMEIQSVRVPLDWIKQGLIF